MAKTHQEHRQKQQKNDETASSKKTPGSAKTLRFKGVGPKFRQSPGEQNPEKTKKKTAKKHKKKPKKGIQTKIAGSAKTLRFKGVGPKFR